MTSTKEITRESYDKVAKEWSAEHFLPACPNNMLDEIATFTKYVKPGRFVLDVGCGPGKHAIELVKAGFELTGIDFSKSMIKEAKRHVPKAEFRVMDMEYLNFKEGTFDGVACFASLLHIQKARAVNVLRGFKKVLKTDGVLVLAVKAGKGERLEKKYGTKRFYAYYSKGELVGKVIKAGFRILKAYYKSTPKDNWIIVFGRASKMGSD